MALDLLGSPPHTMFQQVQATPVHNRIFLDDFLHEGVDMHEILNILHDAGPDDTLEVRINSSGGIARYGQQFINVMFDRFLNRTITVIDSDALSIAALVFLAGDRRVIYPHSSLLFHDLSLSTTGKVNEAIKMLEVIHSIFGEYLTSLMHPFFTADEIKSVSCGLDLCLGAKEMCERGIAHTVIVRGISITAEEYLERLGALKDEKTSNS